MGSCSGNAYPIPNIANSNTDSDHTLGRVSDPVYTIDLDQTLGSRTGVNFVWHLVSILSDLGASRIGADFVYTIHTIDPEHTLGSSGAPAYTNPL